jgi:hypothetical protein
MTSPTLHAMHCSSGRPCLQIGQVMSSAAASSMCWLLLSGLLLLVTTFLLQPLQHSAQATSLHNLQNTTTTIMCVDCYKQGGDARK